jgi:hypothetical protein
MANKIKVSSNEKRFFCPGCKKHHAIGNSWDFNDNMERPTFKPSILVRGGHYEPNHKGPCWCTYDAEHPDNPSGFNCTLCHSFITDGKIQFLSDCAHSLAGQTVELPELED